MAIADISIGIMSGRRSSGVSKAGRERTTLRRPEQAGRRSGMIRRCRNGEVLVPAYVSNAAVATIGREAMALCRPEQAGRRSGMIRRCRNGAVLVPAYVSNAAVATIGREAMALCRPEQAGRRSGTMRRNCVLLVSADDAIRLCRRRLWLSRSTRPANLASDLFDGLPQRARRICAAT